jgi:hypothetical protein
MTERLCPGCQEPLKRRDGERLSEFAGRISCGARPCRAAAYRVASLAREARRPLGGMPCVPLGMEWTVYFTGPHLPAGHEVGAQLRTLVEAGVAVTAIRRGASGQLEYVCRARR